MQRISTLLREARESKELTIEDAAKELKLRHRHIKMLEDGKLNELSREIYLKGFIKTYTNWLNIDGGEVLAHINKEKKKLAAQRSNAPVKAIGLSYISDLSRRPGLNVFLLSAVLNIIIYTIWYSSNQNMVGADIISALQKDENYEQVAFYSNVLEEYIDKELVLFPHDNVVVKILDTNLQKEKLLKLEKGDLSFIRIRNNIVISADFPEKIEVFYEQNSQQEVIGTLDQIIMNF